MYTPSLCCIVFLSPCHPSVKQIWVCFTPHSLVRGDGGYLRGWSGLQPTSVIRLLCQGLSVSADWQLLAEKQSTVPVYAKYVHMCIQIHDAFIYIYLGYVKIPMLQNTHLQMVWQPTYDLTGETCLNANSTWFEAWKQLSFDLKKTQKI